MKKSFLLSGLLILFLLIPITLILSWNNRFDKIDNIEKFYSRGKEEGNFNKVNEKVADNKVEYLVIDRFEGDFAVCENNNGEIENIDKSKLPEEAKEGHVLIIVENRFEIDYHETAKRNSRILKLIESLW